MVAIVQTDDALPLNVVVLSRGQYHLAPYYFEHGWLIVVKDTRIKADLAFLETVALPPDMEKGHVKFVLTHARHAEFDRFRAGTWTKFKQEVFSGGVDRFARFHDIVGDVNGQLHGIADDMFPGYRFQTKRVTWKFEKINGQNLHIDTIQGTNDRAQLRLFVNLATTNRKWSMAEHISVYARRHVTHAGLRDLVHDPIGFNAKLSSVAFGNSSQSAAGPRHEIEFEPGEIWVLNSAVVAHQVRFGSLMAVNCLEFPYADYVYPEQTLPSLIRAVALNHVA